MAILVCVVSSAVWRRVTRRSAWTSLRGLAARLHGVTPRRAGSGAPGRGTASSGVQLLDPIQGEVPDLGVVCRERERERDRREGLSARVISAEPSAGESRSPARQSSVVFGFTCPDVLPLADTRPPRWSGEVDTLIIEKRMIILLVGSA